MTSPLYNWDPGKGDPHEWEAGPKFVVPEFLRDDEARAMPCESVPFSESDVKFFGGPVPLVGKWHTAGSNYHVSDVASLNVAQAHKLLFVTDPDADRGDCRWAYHHMARPLRVSIAYPLDKPVLLGVPPLTVQRYMRHDNTVKESLETSPGYIMWAAAQEYLRVYKEYEEHGVWGHAMGDLVFEGFQIDDDGNCRLLMGS